VVEACLHKQALDLGRACIKLRLTQECDVQPLCMCVCLQACAKHRAVLRSNYLLMKLKLVEMVFVLLV
jgi:hypothetical protein